MLCTHKTTILCQFGLFFVTTHHHSSINSQPFLVGIVSSSRKCTVTGIDQHQINGLDIVQCAALVKTNHGYVNLIMNEYAYYGKGHTIHSSGQIEWNKNQVDDRSVKVGGSQCITTLDGYCFLLKCPGDSCI